ncbi:MAG: replication-relaxation family protein [Anaerolineae bacterium]|nr:replication-relaxation family protein [Anaerolineae bacterium]
MPTNPTSKPIHKRSSMYRRPENPFSGKFTLRDRQILEAIHSHDGILADYQIRALFFTGDSQFRLRMRYLFQHGYVARPSYKRRASLNHLMYWLDTKGAEHVSGLTGTPVTDFVYVKEPRWSQLDHDIAINDVRIAIAKACENDLSNGITLAEWIPQSEFYSHPDKVDYTDIHGTKKSRYVRPDAFFTLQLTEATHHYLLELDMATESNVRFAREKVLPGLAYLKSPVYARRFGHNTGRFLVVTTNERKLRNMKHQTELTAGKEAKFFYFTTASHIRRDEILTKPIWYQGGKDEPMPLIRTNRNMPTSCQ